MNLKPGIRNPERSSYSHIFKATSLFGGVQVFNILIGIVKVKFVAVLLGAVGVGIMGLFNAPLNLIISVTGLGIAVSAVRDISEAHGSGDQTKLAKAINTLLRWSWISGLLGALVTIILAPFLSQWTFGNSEYTWAFVWLSVTMLLQTFSKNQISIIQGVRRIKDVAKASVYGSIAGLITAIPLFYFFGINGIVPSLILTALTGLLLSWHYLRKVEIEPVRMSWRETMFYGKNMVKLGIIITITSIIAFFTGYLLSAFINRIGGASQVGLYNAGWSIIGQSTSLIFTAMTADYFPRLSATNQDDSKTGIIINQQAEMVVLILTPILVLLIVAMPILIRILYTPEFLGTVIFANWLVLSILFKGLIWPVGFLFPAKNNLKTYGLIEISTMIFNILVNIIGYHFYGLEGLGISIVLGYIFGLVLNLGFAYKEYRFRYNLDSVKGFIKSLILVSLVLFISYFLKAPVSYFFGTTVLIIAFIYFFIELDKRVGIQILLTNFFGRFINK